MPNLVGILAPGCDERAIRATVLKQLDSVRMPGVRYDEYLFTHDGFGMGLQDHGILENGSQPVESKDKRFVLMLDGELLNAAELCRSHRQSLSTASLTPPQLALELILTFGVEVAREFVGSFCFVLYDSHTREVTFIADRFGFRPLFYCHRGQTMLFGTEMKAIRAADETPGDIDELATFELFAYGCHVIDQTWLKGVQRIRPATVVRISDSAVRQKAYWSYRYDETARPLDQDTYVLSFAKLLDQATERAMQGNHRIGIFLSGGYDSRSIAASIRPHYKPLPAITFGHPFSRDVRFARMLAQRLRLDHHAIANPTPYLQRACRLAVWRTEGLSSFANCTSVVHHGFLKEKMDIILLGLLAEFSGSHTWPRLLLARSRKAAIEAIFERLVGKRLPKVRQVFRPQFFDRSLEALRARFEQSFDVIDNDHPLNVADAWQFSHMQFFRGFQTASADRYLFEARMPHMDKDLVEFLLTIPPFARLEQRVYKKVIAYSFPIIRDIPCTNSGLPVNANFLSEYALMILRYAGRTMAEFFQKPATVPASLGREFRDLDEDFRSEPAVMTDILYPMLGEGVFPDSMFNTVGISAVIDEHYGRKGNHAELLSLLISWGLAVQYLLRTTPVRFPDDIPVSHRQSRDSPMLISASR